MREVPKMERAAQHSATAGSLKLRKNKIKHGRERGGVKRVRRGEENGREINSKWDRERGS